jgi:hypothetical protein
VRWWVILQLYWENVFDFYSLYSCHISTYWNDCHCDMSQWRRSSKRRHRRQFGISVATDIYFLLSCFWVITYIPKRSNSIRRLFSIPKVQGRHMCRLASQFFLISASFGFIPWCFKFCGSWLTCSVDYFVESQYRKAYCDWTKHWVNEATCFESRRRQEVVFLFTKTCRLASLTIHIYFQ